VRVTWGFAYLLIFLGGFTLSLVTGFARRLLHPTQLCDHVVVPSHEHIHALRVPAADLVSSFLTVFGLVCLLVHGLTPLTPSQAISIGGVAGIIGIFILRAWLPKVCAPTDNIESATRQVAVVREIPSKGYGQVQLEVEGSSLKLAARSDESGSIPVGSVVEIMDRTESVVVVRRKS
jgi:membrane protein implicated in regulation of membrane protease activity